MHLPASPVIIFQKGTDIRLHFIERYLVVRNALHTNLPSQTLMKKKGLQTKRFGYHSPIVAKNPP